MHALSDLGTPSVLTVAQSAFRPKCRTAGRAVWLVTGSRNRGDKEREANKKHHQNCRGKCHMVLSPILCHGFSLYLHFPFTGARFFSIGRRNRQLKPSLVIGRSLTLFPVAAKMALQNAAINGGTPGSPTPAGGASLSTM